MWFLLPKECFLVCPPSWNMGKKQYFLVCPPSGNMARKQCFLVCPPSRNIARKQCFLVCPPLGNMARKQCFLVCPPLENMARKQCSLVCLPIINRKVHLLDFMINSLYNLLDACVSMDSISFPLPSLTSNFSTISTVSFTLTSCSADSWLLKTFTTIYGWKLTSLLT
jgi:hypothetical protein